MRKQGEMIIKKGQILVLSEGDYSDYGIVGLFKALKDFDAQTVVKENTKSLVLCSMQNYHPDTTYTYESLIVFLTTNGFLEELEYDEKDFSRLNNIAW